MHESMRVMPMTNPLPLWDKNSENVYPDMLKMAFRDGKVMVYRLAVEQPAPHTFNERAVAELERNCFGGYVGKHAKK